MDYSRALQRNDSSAPSNSKKNCAGQDDFDRYSFPISTLAAITSRVVFTEIEKLDSKTMTSPHAAQLYPSSERYMRRAEIAKISTLLEEVVWMCDLVLNTHVKDHVWARFFRDGRYHFAITSKSKGRGQLTMSDGC